MARCLILLVLIFSFLPMSHAVFPKEIAQKIEKEKKDEPLTVKIGDQVLYGKYSGTEINIEGKDYLIMRESDILAVI